MISNTEVNDGTNFIGTEIVGTQVTDAGDPQPLTHSPHAFEESSHNNGAIPELFQVNASAQAEEELDDIENSPLQETIEGAGMYDPNINRLPDSDGDIEEAEDIELEEFSHIIEETTAMIVRDNMERVKVQYHKVLLKYRQEGTRLQREHESERKYLETQIESEKSRNLEGMAMQKMLGEKLRERREEIKGLQSLSVEFQEKKKQVAGLREKLDEREKELTGVREEMATLNKKMCAEMLPISTSSRESSRLKMLDDMKETKDYINAIMKLMPDETALKDEIKKYNRLNTGRPATTGMLHREPNT